MTLSLVDEIKIKTHIKAFHYSDVSVATPCAGSQLNICPENYNLEIVSSLHSALNIFPIKTG